jgi:hypothetical protein
MIRRALGVAALLFGPALAVQWAGYGHLAPYIALGAALAFNLGLLARPLAPFAMLVPVVYAAAAFTAQLSDGVAALIVAVAAVVGAASSQGFHRGLLSILAAALIGSFEPAASALVVTRAAALLAGCAYGLFVVLTIARAVEMPGRAVHPQTALSYAVLLAVLTLVAWLAARLAGIPQGWWLPLAVAAVGEPSLTGTAQRAVSRTAAILCATVPLVALVDSIADPVARLALVIVLSVLVMIAGRRWTWSRGFLLTPILVLLISPQPALDAAVPYLPPTLLACAGVFTLAVLGKWLLWTLRPDVGRVTA